MSRKKEAALVGDSVTAPTRVPASHGRRRMSPACREAQADRTACIANVHLLDSH
ncbi:MAG TPA: hypothetical protein P5555_03105 [Candidatus Paceibacterota bacterium]|nr:hypothetical protein [Candidatus Paceibacterota bacterium]HRZ91322.1 hypothetical protein [Candidatus Paceibacterota bacterium]